MNLLRELMKPAVKFMGHFLVLLVTVSAVQAQEITFRNPLDIPMQLSSNFGEVRSDHFHTGYDFRTNGKTGYKVYAAADGYVSRIKVAAGGFGNVLYIHHTGGYMTVYAHLEAFNEPIAQYVKKQQYARESFEVEMFPDASMFPVKKGDLIAWSGNSGSSGGPHLHFEIRDAGGESYPLNPYRFIPYEDKTMPRITRLWVYPAVTCCGVLPPASYGLVATAGDAKLKTDSITVNHATIGLGIETEDFADQFTGDLGVHKMEVQMDGELVYQFTLDRLVFANNRFLNAHIDYAKWKQSSIVIRKLFRLPGDRNSLYGHLNNGGKIQFTDTNWHTVRIQVYDAAGNLTKLNFRMRYSGNEASFDPPKSSAWFRYETMNSFQSDSIRISMPDKVLYDDLPFQFGKGTTGTAAYLSPVYHVHNPYAPLHGNFDLFILPRRIPEALKKKALIVYVNAEGKRMARKSRWEGDWLTAAVRDFGDYYVTADTVKPVITPSGIRQNQVITRSEIRFTVSDNLAGISTYRAMLNGKWVLMEFDPKNDRMTCKLEETLKAGDHVLELTVVDAVGNQANYRLSFKK